VRLLRAARLEAELNFVSDAQTELYIARDAHLLASAAMERVRDELVKIMAAEHVLRNLRRLDALDLLGRVLPEVNAMRGVTQSPPHIYDVFEHTLHAIAAAEEVARADYLNLAEGAFGTQLSEHMNRVVAGGHTRSELLRLALLLHDIAKPSTRSVGEDGRIHFYRHDEAGADVAEDALRRLKFSGEEIAHVLTIVRNHMRPLDFVLNGMTDRGIHRYFRATGDVGIDIAVHSWCDQRGAFGVEAEDPEINELQAVIGRLFDRYYHAREQIVSPPALVNGDDVQRLLGIPPGRKIGEILDAVREAQVTGEITSREGALEFLEKFDPPA
jgi:tRNA nucleotidyltransferase/poly(A) polymerase